MRILRENASIVALSVVVVGVCLIPKDAQANGQSTHLWITDHALTHVPDGPLETFLTRPELRKMLDNGTMFPDGGYPIDDPYAEIAHWEPFQVTYLDWIIANYPELGASPEGAEHLAFMLGMASHGMADQVFDSLYGERVKAYDGALGEFDTASDIIMMSNFEPMNAPGDWVPYDTFDQVYDEVGYDVDPAKMMQGQMYLRIAVNAVAVFSQMPDEVAEAAAPFPWGSEHLLDAEVEGSPPCEGEVIARYWRVLWAMAHGQPLPGPVMATLPADGGANHPIDSSSLESWVSVVFSRGLESDPLSADSFHVVPDAGGPEVPITIWHYYGQDAHVVHLRPQEDLAPDTVYRVSVDPEIVTIHGEVLDGYAFRFSTGPEGPEPTAPAWPPDHDPDPDEGETGGETGGETEGGDTGETEGGDTSGSTGDGDGDGETTDAGGSDGESGESGTRPGASETGGCGCTQADTPTKGGLAWLALMLGAGLGLGRRRRRARARGL